LGPKQGLLLKSLPVGTRVLVAPAEVSSWAPGLALLVAQWLLVLVWVPMAKEATWTFMPGALFRVQVVDPWLCRLDHRRWEHQGRCLSALETRHCCPEMSLSKQAYPLAAAVLWLLFLALALRLVGPYLFGLDLRQDCKVLLALPLLLAARARSVVPSR
jgi:hypothetical protein